MKFEKATRKKAKLRLALSGPSGAGKTLSALLLAKGIGGQIAVLDSERDSASLYAEPVRLPNGTVLQPPEFDALNLTAPYTPERYIEAIHTAEAAGYTTLIIDSITHEWSGVGGCLELVDEIARAKYKGNSWSAWNDITPRHRALLDAILQSPMHVIVTLRSKTETAQQEGSNGRKQVVKLGMKAEQRDGFEYEMTVVLDLTHDGHFAMATKDRTGLLMGRDPFVVDEQLGLELLQWLESGAEVVDPMAAMLDSIRTAVTLDALRGNFEAAYVMTADSDARAKIIEAKDARKAELLSQQLPHDHTGQEGATESGIPAQVDA